MKQRTAENTRSTWDKLKAMGLSPGDVVIAPGGPARLRRPQWSYAMVRYANGTIIGYVPSLLRKATDAERAAFEQDEEARSVKW